MVNANIGPDPKLAISGMKQQAMAGERDEISTGMVGIVVSRGKIKIWRDVDFGVYWGYNLYSL
jgi:hypothetical protein